MDIKSEIDIKLEELDPEFDDFQHCSQIFPVNGAELALSVSKNEELDEKESVNSELKEFEFVSVLEEEPINDGVKSENETLIDKSSDQHSKHNMASKKPNIIRDVEEILNILDNDEQPEIVSTEIDAADLLEIVLNPPQDGGDSDRDEANSDAEEFTTNVRNIGKGVLSQKAELRAIRKGLTIDIQVDEEISEPSTSQSKKQCITSIKSKKFIFRKWSSKSLKKSSNIYDCNAAKIKPAILENIEKSQGKPIDLFKMCFTEEFMSHICRESVKYASQKGDQQFTLSIDELYVYFGILLLSGYNKLPFRRMYWERRPDSNNNLTFITNAGQSVQDFKLRSSLRRKSPALVTQDQIMKKKFQDNLGCKYSYFSFKNKDPLKVQKRKVKCNLCSFECNLESSLKRHQLIHNNFKLFKFSECSFERNRKVLKIHMLSHRDGKLFKCSECRYECYEKGNLKSHMLKHRDTKLFKCSECNYECNHKISFKNHYMLRHKNTKLFKCSECTFESNHKSSLQRHFLGHQNVKLFKCSMCTYEGNDKGNFRRHMLTHRDTKLFKCSECSYECNVKASLKSHHMLKHENTKLFKCSECTFESNHKNSLQRHILSHQDTKLFKCSECSHEYNDKGNLRRHMLKHRDTKLFKCSECSYGCNDKRSFNRHMLTHQDTKLFKCSECSYGCNEKGCLIRHMLKHRDTKLFKCSECSYGCNDKRNFKSHMLKH